MRMTGKCASALGPEALKEARQQMEKSAENKLWAMKNMDRLRSRYPNKYVALDDGRVLAFGNTSEEVFEALRKKRVADISTLAIEFVSKDPYVWIL